MPGKKLKITGVVGIISALLFTGAFAAYNGRRTEDSAATSSIGCSVNSQVRIFFSDISQYSNRDQRVLFDDASPSAAQARTFTIPGKYISPGKYEVRTISSDNHFNHRSSDPDQDIQVQPNEQYYITLDGQRAAKHSSDFTDYYDWGGADGELLQDDDNNTDTVPEVIRNTWQGESLGTIEIANNTSAVTVEHVDVYDDIVPRYNSVIPSALILDCVEPQKPVLEVEKYVDANADSVFNAEQEQSKDGETIQWKVTGKNTGQVPDNAAVVTSCAPAGTSYVSDSAAITDGGQNGTLTQEGGCFTWTGPLAADGMASIVFDVIADDIDACDVADGTEDGVCTCIAKIYSDTTGTTAADPADTDDAGVNQLLPDLSIIKKVDGSDDNDSYSDDSEQITPDGSQVAWEITAANAGPGDMDNARVVDTYPSGVTLGTATATTGDVAIDGSEVVWNGALASGGEVIITVNSTVDDVAGFNECEAADDAPGNTVGDGVCTNRAFVGEASATSANEFDGETKHDDAEVYAVLSPSLTIKKYVEGSDDDTIFSDEDAETITQAEVFVWRVEGCNIGDVIEPNARIVDVVPAGVNLEDIAAANVRVNGVTGGSGVTYTTDPDSGRPAIVWNGSLSVGGCVEIEYTTIVTNEAGFIECEAASTGIDGVCGVPAYIGTATDDSDISVDLLTKSSDPAFVIALFESILGIEKFVDGNEDDTFDPLVEQVGLNEIFTWKIIATNTGSSNEPNARVIDPIPSDLELTSTEAQIQLTEVAGATTGSVSIAQQNGVDTIVWDGSLPIGASIEIMFATQLVSEDTLNDCIAATEGDNCRNTASIGRADIVFPTQITGQTSTDSADVFANPTGKLTVKKEVDVDGDGSWSGLETITFDTWFDWRISVSNQGDGAIDDAAVLDVFPEGVIIDSITSEPSFGTSSLDAGERNMRLFWTAPTLGVGETAEFVVRAKIADLGAFNLCDEGTVDGNKDDMCTNKVFVGTGTDPDNFNDVDEDEAQVDVLAVPDLYIDKPVDGTDNDKETSDFEIVTTNSEEFEWTLSFGNKGTGIAEGVTVVDGLPDGVTYISHNVDSGEATYDEASRRITWNGSIDPGQEVTLKIQNSFATAEDFRKCDIADGVEDQSCRNTTRLTYEDIELEDPAFVLSGSASPLLIIDKTVDANADGTFSDIENISSAGVVATWRVEARNDGDSAVSSLSVVDEVMNGLIFVPDSITELEGAALGVAQYKDGIVEWVGGLGAGEKVIFTFQTQVLSAVEFTSCNFSDGNANDAICTNTARITLGVTSSAVSEDSAGLTTSLATVLAYTGSKSYSPILVGAAITFAAAILMFGAYRSRGGDGFDGGDTPQTPMSSSPPPQVIRPRE